jgi:hypothetical protein
MVSTHTGEKMHVTSRCDSEIGWEGSHVMCYRDRYSAVRSWERHDLHHWIGIGYRGWLETASSSGAGFLAASARNRSRAITGASVADSI